MTAPAHNTTEAWDELPSGTSVVRHQASVPDLASPQQIAAYAAAFDDQAFLAGIVGEAMDKWFYEFSIAGKTVEGVSVVGAEEFARLRAEQGFPIRFPPGSIRAEEVSRNGELGIQVTVIARECRSGADGLGMAFYPYMVERKKDGEVVRVADNFPDRKALSVAKRNAILDLIPAATIIGVLKQKKAIIAANATREEGRIQSLMEGRPLVSGPPIRTRVISSGARTEQPATTEGGSPACPKCGGECWDNRPKKATGEFKSTSPDFACKDKACGGKIWPPRGNTQGALPMDDEVRTGKDALAAG